jgi:hypothetical protein
VEEVEKNKVLLLGKLTDTATNERKKTMWVTIAGRLSAVGNNKRSPAEIRNKWLDWAIQTKGRMAKQIRESGATGGGPRVEETFTPLEDNILDIMGTTAVEGLPTGVDTLSVNDNSHDQLNIDPRSVSQKENDISCKEQLIDTDTESGVQGNNEPDASDEVSRLERERQIDQQLRKIVSEGERKRKSIGKETQNRKKSNKIVNDSNKRFCNSKS